MGYTHYWSHDDGLDEKALTTAFVEIKQVLAALEARGIRIAGGDGRGNPEVNEEVVCFNGPKHSDLSHETFIFPVVGEDAAYSRKANHGQLWNFCKTARKPYDLAVTASLLVLKHHLGDALRLSSDGDSEDWEAAESLVSDLFGYDVHFLQEQTRKAASARG